jgi:membrane protease YdiL (CAAX protease family)
VARRGPLRIERRPGWRRATVAGLVSGAVLALALAALYSVLSGRSAITADAAERIRTTLVEFRIVTPAGFVALAAGLAVVHSLLEEVYWRAFVYRRLGGWLPPRLALALASAAFASHHLIVAARYTPAGHFWSLTLPATVAVALAGAHWADLYRRTGSLLAPWTSHLVVDTALMGIGYALVWGGDG